jgi:hypothetical protein
VVYASIILLFVWRHDLVAQVDQPTIPELVTQAGKSLAGMRLVPSGTPPTVVDVLRDTDLIVRGTLGKSHSYLSPDQREVLTDYDVLKPEFLFERQLPAAAQPGVPRAVTLTLLGGSVSVGGFTYTFTDKAVQPLNTGTTCLLLLKKVAGRYRLAGDYLGIFKIDDDKLVPFTGKQGFAAELRNTKSSRAIAEMTETIRSIHR